MFDILVLAQQEGDGGGWLVGGGMFLVIVLLGLLSLAVWIWALVDAIRNPALDGTMRLVWVLVIVFTGIIGAIIYLAIGRSSTARPATPGREL